MEHPPRDRVTIELRGLREQLQMHALRKQMTPATLVREALLAYLAPTPSNQTPELQKLPLLRDKQLVKVTLRLPRGHVELMNRLARRADVSQSIYVATLIEGSPPPTNHTQTVAALQRASRHSISASRGRTDWLESLWSCELPPALLVLPLVQQRQVIKDHRPQGLGTVRKRRACKVGEHKAVTNVRPGGDQLFDL